MYRGNGNTKRFPLPEGADGAAVYLETAFGAIRLRQGDAYDVDGRDVVFRHAPGEGVIISFQDKEDVPSSMDGVRCMVLYPDGRMEPVCEDPLTLLVEARTEQDEAKKLLKEAKKEAENLEILVHQQSELAKEKISARLERYGGLIEESVKNAAALARDEVKDHLDRLMLEIRNKHKAVVVMHEQMQGILQEAKEVASASAHKAADEVGSLCSEALRACEEMRRLVSETLILRDEARRTATMAAADTKKEAETYLSLVAEEVRSLKQTLNNEVSAVVSGIKRELDADLREIRAHRIEMIRGTKNMNRVERYVIEKKDEIEAAVNAAKEEK